MAENKDTRTAIIVAIIGTVGVLGAAIISNIDKIRNAQSQGTVNNSSIAAPANLSPQLSVNSSNFNNKNVNVTSPTPSTPSVSPTRFNYNFDGLEIRIIYIARRKEEALSVAKRLRDYGAKVELNETTDSSNESHAGKIYYGESNLSRAQEIAQSISDKVKVVPSLYEEKYKYDSDFSVWIAQ